MSNDKCLQKTKYIKAIQPLTESLFRYLIKIRKPSEA